MDRTSALIAKMLKIELFCLFLLTLFSCFGHYYKEFLPDSFFSISSDTSSINYISYYFTTFIMFTGYYSGPWLFFPFIIFALFYSFQFSKRNYKLDPFNIFFLLIWLLILCYLVVPSALGDGVYYLIQKHFSTTLLILAAIVSFLVFIFVCYRISFKQTVITVTASIWNSPDLMNKMLHALNPVKAASATAIIYKRCISIVKTKIPSFLQGHTSAASSKAVIIHSLALPKSEPVLKNDFDLEVELENSKATDKVIKDENIKSSHPIWDEKKYSELIDCLAMNRSINKVSHPDDKYFEQIISRIEDKLNDFRIDGVIVDVLKGPVVDTFLLELGKGVKVSKVTSSADDLSGALYGAPIRIVYPMRGRTSVGIEVPRNPREIIYLDEVLASSEYKDCNQHLPIAIGKDAYGKTFIVDLADMPHMLVAGATGAGKSVFINTLLVSLLVKKSPQDMKLILIDPKQLELAQYAKLPHLALPVINDGKSASLALLWAVQEMERRYSIMMEFGVRNVETFNSKILHASSNDVDSIRKFYEAGHNEDYKLPYVVVIIDEFADLILSKAGKEIENNVCRLAGKARAAGIHLVIATQRPSVDVITGLIKSNFPTRISFRVTTSIDSRTILSAMGAEKLLGKGDMLYKRGVDTARVHSSYVDEDEILALVNNLCSLPTEFDKSAMDFLESDGSPDESDPYAFGSHIPTVLESGGGDDELYDEAVSVVMEYRAASASMLQRRLKIGYNRAANLVELMEEKGIVGPAQGSKPRKILVSLD